LIFFCELCHIYSNIRFIGWHRCFNGKAVCTQLHFYRIVPAFQKEAKTVNITYRLVGEQQLTRYQLIPTRRCKVAWSPCEINTTTRPSEHQTSCVLCVTCIRQQHPTEQRRSSWLRQWFRFRCWVNSRTFRTLWNPSICLKIKIIVNISIYLNIVQLFYYFYV
jgi:hypothetical protein